MKILFVSESYLPKLCGITSVTRYLAEGLVKKGHDVTVVTQTHYEKDTSYDKINGVDIFRYSIHRGLLKNPLGDVDGLINYIINSVFDVYVFECIGSLTSDILMPYIDKIKGIKILHSHGNQFSTMAPFIKRQNLKYTLGNTYNYIRLGIQNYLLTPKFIRSFDMTIILSQVSSDKNIVEQYSTKYTVLDNAADDMFFTEYTSKLPLSYNLGTKYKKYIISIANYQKVKNQLLMVKSYFLSDVKNVSLLLIGSQKNDYYKKVKDYISTMKGKYPDKDVVMLTNVDRVFIPNILKYAELYLVCSEKEEYSISLAEAMSLGIPFVSTNVGNARILPAGITVMNKNLIPDAITKMIKNNDLRKNFSKAAKEYADSHNKESLAICKFEKILNDLYNKRK